MQTFLKPFKKLAGRVLLRLKPLALRARGLKPNKTLLLVFWIVHKIMRFYFQLVDGKWKSVEIVMFCARIHSLWSWSQSYSARRIRTWPKSGSVIHLPYSTSYFLICNWSILVFDFRCNQCEWRFLWQVMSLVSTDKVTPIVCSPVA
jgi:hypothetical protein